MTDHKTLIQAHFNGQLTPEQMQELRAWLHADARHVRVFVRYGALHSALHDYWKQKDLRTSIDYFAMVESSDENPDIPVKEDLIPEIQHPHRRIEPRFLGIMAAVVIALVWLLWWAMDSYMVPPIARLIRVENAQWEGAKISIPVNSILTAETLSLSQGLAEIRLRGDARLIVCAPCKFTINEANDIELQSGEIVAHITDRTSAFRIRTPHAQILDLGTSFGVRVMPEKQTDVSVFRGSVRITQIKKRGKPLALNAGQTCSINTQGHIQQSNLSSASDGFVRKILVPGLIDVQGDIRFAPPPLSNQDALLPISDKHAFALLERSGVVLNKPLEVFVPKSNTWYGSDILSSAQSLPYRTLPAGKRVDCYLIHASRRDTSNNQTIFKTLYEGSLQFKGRILGLIIRGRRLYATDSLFTVDHWDYSRMQLYRRHYDIPFRGINRANDGDWVRISDHGHHLDFRFATDIGGDQIRVLVEPHMLQHGE